MNLQAISIICVSQFSFLIHRHNSNLTNHHQIVFAENTLVFPCVKNKHFMLHNKLLTRDGIQRNNINDMAELMILFFTKSTEIIEVNLIRGVSTSIAIYTFYHQSRYYF